MNVSTLSIFTREFGAEMTKSRRMPEFAIPTVVLPVVFYALFGVVLAKDAQAAPYLLATFGVFAALGPSLFGFGIGIATEREEGTLALKSVSPMPAYVYPLAKLAMTVAFVALVLAMVYAVGIFAGGVTFTPAQWAGLLAVHLASVVPFSLLGIFLGYTLKSQGAIAFANVLFFPLAVLGGLWMPIFVFPAFMQGVAQVLPSYHLAQLALIAGGIQPPVDVWLHIAAIGAWTIVLAGLVAWAVRREAD
jgi:ABC-2 type transport system permease protein